MLLPIRCFITLVFASILFFMAGCMPVLAASQNNTTPPANTQDLHTLSQRVTIEVLSAFTCQLAGIDSNKQPCLGIDNQTGKVGYVPSHGGALGIMTGMIASTYNPPLHITDYTSYLSQNFGIVKPVYAQTTGIDGLRPLQKLWITFRDIVYLLYVLIFMLVGLGIMLRIKIDPRTVMSLENQLPKVIISLILVTFSFAIVGVMVDFMYVSTYLITNVISSASPDPTLASKVQADFYTPPIGFVNKVIPAAGDDGGLLAITKDSAGGVKDLVQSIFANPQEGIFDWNTKTANCQGFDPICWATQGLGSTVGEIVSGILGWILGWVLGGLGLIVIIIALLWALFRLWFALLKAYVMILIHTVLSPFWITFGLFPNSPLGFSKWFREMTAELSVFPTAIGMILLGKVFMESFAQGGPVGAHLFVPPLIGNPNVQNTMAAIIALGTILLTPQVVNIVKDILKTPAFKYGAGIGQALGAGTKPLGNMGGGGSRLLLGTEYKPENLGTTHVGKLLRAFGVGR